MYRQVDPSGRMQILYNSDFADQDLYVREIGHSLSCPGVVKGPWIRDSFILHYIRQGRGLFNGCPAGPGQGFLIVPQAVHTFQADLNDPWEHCWIMFDGAKARMLLEQSCLAVQNHVFAMPMVSQCFAVLQAALTEEQTDCGCAWSMLSALLRLLSWHGKSLAEPAPTDPQTLYVRQAVAYMQANYCRDIAVADIAAAVNLSAKYLCRLFQTRLGSSPQNYLIRLRVSRAEALLVRPDLSVSEIARSVGYENPLYFSQVFRKHRGKTPTEHRRMALQQ